MYRHFNKPYVLMLNAVLFSLFQCASTIVTYMIVLVQFKQSDKSQNACSRNVTNWVTWRLKLIYAMWQRELHNLLLLLLLLLSSLLLLLLLLLLLSSSSSSSFSSSSSLPTRSPLLSRHQYGVIGTCFFLIERLYMWQNRPDRVNIKILIFWPIVGRQWGAW